MIGIIVLTLKVIAALVGATALVLLLPDPFARLLCRRHITDPRGVQFRAATKTLTVLGWVFRIFGGVAPGALTISKRTVLVDMGWFGAQNADRQAQIIRHELRHATWQATSAGIFWLPDYIYAFIRDGADNTYERDARSAAGES